MDAIQTEIVKELLARVKSARKIEDQGGGFIHFRVGKLLCSVKAYNSFVWLNVTATRDLGSYQIESGASDLRKLYDAVAARAMIQSQTNGRRILASLRPWWRRWFGK